MGIDSGNGNSNGSSAQSAVEKQQLKLKAQQQAQARQLQQSRIELIKGAAEGQNLGLTKQPVPSLTPSPKPGFNIGGLFPRNQFTKNLLGGENDI